MHHGYSYAGGRCNCYCASTSRRHDVAMRRCSTRSVRLPTGWILWLIISLAKRAGSQATAGGVEYQLAPYYTPGAARHSCDSLCASKGLYCDPAMQASLTAPDHVTAAFAQAGHACTNTETRCGNNCERWGAPYVHGDSTLCVYGAVASPCDQIPSDSHHRRVCACSPPLPPAPPSPPSPPPLPPLPPLPPQVRRWKRSPPLGFDLARVGRQL